jgi:serine/threonine-protein kinase HipA
VHFEEFNQLLQRRSQDKYAGGHKEMSEYIRAHQECIPVDNYRLYARIIAGLLLGNTDMHFKNFAMFNTPAGLRLTPSYDQVAAALYEYKTVALAIGGAENLLIGNIKPKNLLVLADEFNLPPSSVVMAVKQLQHNREAAKEAIVSAKQGSRTFKDQLIKLMDTRWNGSFASIGKVLSTKQSSGAKNKN